MANVLHNSLSKYGGHNDPYSLNDQTVSINYMWNKPKTGCSLEKCSLKFVQIPVEIGTNKFGNFYN